MTPMMTSLMQKYLANHQTQQGAQPQVSPMQPQGLAELLGSYTQPNQSPPMPTPMARKMPAHSWNGMQAGGGGGMLPRSPDSNYQMPGEQPVMLAGDGSGQPPMPNPGLVPMPGQGNTMFAGGGGGQVPVNRTPSAGLNSLLERIRSGGAGRKPAPQLPIGDPPAQAVPTGGLSSLVGPQKRSSMRKATRLFAAGGLVDDEEPEAEMLALPESTPTDFMEQMLAQYMQPENRYAEELAKARNDAALKQSEFDALIKQASERKSEGPSRSELFFNLAAAFGTPGKTGNFFEQVGNAGKVLADNKRQKRENARDQQTQSLNLALERAKLGVASSREDTNNLRSLANEESKSKRAIVMAQLKANLDAGKPQSEAGKIALDSGLKPGTPEYGAFVQNYVQKKLENGSLYKEAMLGIAQSGLKIRQQQADTSSTQAATTAAQATKLTPAEVKLKDEAEAAMNAAKVAYGQLAKVYSMPDSAYASSGIDRIKKGVLGAVGSADPAYLASQEVENLLGRAGVAGLKTTLGPQISDSDVRIGTALEGMSATSGAARKKIVKNTMDALKESYLYRKKRYEELAKGGYRMPAQPEFGPGIDELPLDMEDLGAP